MTNWTNQRNARPRRGFTLLEVLLVLAILGLIAVMVVPQLLGRQQDAMDKITETSIKGLESVMNMYAIDHAGKFPEGSAQEVYRTLLQPVEFQGRAPRPYLDTVPLDAWKNPLLYEYPARNKKTAGGKPAIWSAGADGQNNDGQEDDINNWDLAGLEALP